MSEVALFCKNHPRRETRVRCSSCGEPICTRCMKPAAVGIKCPQCARPAARARRPVSPGRHLLAAVAGLGAAILIGAATLRLQIPFAGFLVPIAGGIAVGEVVSRAARRSRSGISVAIAAGSAALGIAAGTVLAGLPFPLAVSGAYGAVLAAIAAGFWVGR